MPPLVYRGCYRKIILYFYDRRKKIPAFQDGWRRAAGRSNSTGREPLKELFNTGRLAGPRQADKHKGPITEETLKTVFWYGKQVQTYRDCSIHTHNFESGIYAIDDRAVASELLRWGRRRSREETKDQKENFGISLAGCVGIYMTPTECYTYKEVFRWNPKELKANITSRKFFTRKLKEEEVTHVTVYATMMNDSSSFD